MGISALMMILVGAVVYIGEGLLMGALLLFWGLWECVKLVIMIAFDVNVALILGIYLASQGHWGWGIGYAVVGLMVTSLRLAAGSEA